MAEEGFKRKLTAILSADVAGYSRLMSEDEAATVKTLAAYREIMASLIKQHRGRVVDSPGDNMLAEFASVVDAVQCAVAVQKEFQARNAELPENRRMEFRIGINLGDVIEEEDRIYGDGVNIAARLEALADPGGICVSKTAFDQIETKLPLGYEYLGEQPVKNIPKPVGAYRVLMEPRVTVAEEIEKVKTVPLWQRKTLLAAGVVLLLVVIAALIWNFYFRPPPIEPASVEKMAFPLPDKPSIAVLAFTNMTGDPEQEYIGDGISVNIITALSKVSKMLVIDRNSTFTYKGKPVKIQQVAEELGVQYVLEGSVQKSGDRLRVTAQLIDALSGHHLWSEKYDREMKELFDLQDEITKKIVVSLEVEFGQYERARIYAKSTNNLEAWSYVIKGFNLFMKFNKQDNAKARELLEKAIRLDPEYSIAWSWLYLIHAQDARSGWSESPVDSRKRAKECLQKALALDDENSLAHTFLGLFYLRKRQHDKAVAEGKRAISLDPNSTGGLACFSFILHHSGRFEEAIEQMKKAIRLGARYHAYFLFKFALNYAFLGRYNEAIAALNRFEERCRKGEFPIGSIALAQTGFAVVYVELGRVEEARALVAKALKANPDLSLKRFKGPPYKDPVYLQRLIENLRKAGLPETPPLPLPDKPSIAVLPFVNMSGDPEQEYISDGITEEIITALSRTPKLFVIARTSSFKYKGKEVDVRRVGRELGVRYVLEGSVRMSKDQLRITAQLVDAKTGSHVWAERYDRELKDIFALQDEITVKILSALDVKLVTGGEVAAPYMGRGTKNVQAYLKFMQAEHYLARGTPDDYALARKLSEEAIALDPEYPSPYRTLAFTHILDALLRTSKSPRESMNKAFDLAQKVLAMDESDARGHVILGNVYMYRGEHEKAIAELERAVVLDPNRAKSYMSLADSLTYAGRPQEAIPLLKKSMRLSPLSQTHASMCLYRLGKAHHTMGQQEEALSALKKAANIRPNFWAIQLYLAATYIDLGREEEARAAADEVRRIFTKFSLERFAKRLKYKDQAVKERLIDAWRKAGLK
jgi:adenylate cyclase